MRAPIKPDAQASSIRRLDGEALPGRSEMRTTPAVLGLLSLITLGATTRFDTGTLPRAAAWYDITNLTFGDAIAAGSYRL